MPELLRLDRLTKRFGALKAVDDLTLALNEGEALGVIGPNGAGKTTMFNLITGDIRPDTGQVIFAGADISSAPPEKRCHAGIGRSYQIPHPFGGMTVFENVLVGATFGAGRSEGEAGDDCLDILRRTGLARHANKLAGTLPLLDRKRLELARALATRPKVLLLDEIAGGLTEHEVRDLIETIRDIRARGISIIWIEHIVHALTAVVDRLAVVVFGKLLQEGNPAEVMASPAVQETYMGIAVE
ncbi:MAG TPA: ABC transporter ATP-binding protein [Magnetospirillaceae bacterium]|jgi:branched-chain amino acid transport system ATP-binding protein